MYIVYYFEVIRGGRRVELSIFDVVVGDVVALNIGDQVPADGILITGHSLGIDESAMTGESKIVHKNLRLPFLLSGCKVVTSVGINTEWGLLMASISEDTGEETPMQIPLNGIATFIGIVGVVGAIGVLVVLLIRFFTGHTKNPDGSIQFKRGKTSANDAANGTIKIISNSVGIVADAVDAVIKILSIMFGHHCQNCKHFGELPHELPSWINLFLYQLSELLLQFVCNSRNDDQIVDKMEVTIVVVAVPEGLPLAVTLMSIKVELQVRRLSACETMGSATTICSDKTGIKEDGLAWSMDSYRCMEIMYGIVMRSKGHMIIKFQFESVQTISMTVVSAYIGGQKIDPPESKSELPPMLSTLLIEGIAQNTNGSVFVPEGGEDLEVSGSPTEMAILIWGVKLGMNFPTVRSESTVIHVFPFNSEKKRGGAALRLPDSQVHIHWKGAAEIILALCTGYIDANDHIVPMDEDKKLFFKQAIDDMAAGSLRCVAIAYRSYEIEKVPVDEEQPTEWALPEDDLILLAIIGLKVSNGVMVLKHYKSTVIQGPNSISLSLVQFWATFRTTLILDETDPCRPGVKEVVRLCQNAGVKVRMITGDNLKTAKAIALECGILSSDENAREPYLIEGSSLIRSIKRQINLKHLVPPFNVKVMGRSSPNDKLLLVQALQKRKHVVAVTGDGTNDAPALHEADVGLSMGIQGTEVAKESSDIVVRWGRSVYANIQKFIQFQLSVNVATIIINIVAAIFSGEVPLNTVQLLWVNLIMDTLGALALATEPPTDHLMHKPPVGHRAPLITNIMWRNLLIQTIYQASVVLVLAFRGRSLLGLQHQSAEHANKVNHTIMFNAFVLCQIFNEFNARQPDEKNIFKGITKNHWFMGIAAVEIILQFIIVEFNRKFTSTVGLNWKQWLISVAIGFMRLIPKPDDL
ncbi:hypothetical protein GH714_020628 [Hevea brasiliensis]|uniref:P-type Ca(2+) transporter n=1 Tax=Hevea brasiliensis TaxID=3981 RepID=A0A6A6M2E8_HEVBR|nr:hypothetical protein GH714_020628 [Hevea brasiliensis]